MSTPISKHIIQVGTDLDGFGPIYPPSKSTPPGMKLPPNPYSGWPSNGNEPLAARERAPPLPKIELEPSTVDFIEIFDNGLNEDAPSGVFRVNIAGMGERVLKIFHREERYFKGRNFFREAHGYAALLRDGVCAAGVVPQCYGWTAINHLKFPAIDGQYDWLLHFRDETKLMHALVLEYLPNASQMTLRCTNPETAKKAMLGLDMIHQAGVLHNDIHPRNMLVVSDGSDHRVVWIDFESSSVWPLDNIVNNNNTYEENGFAWFWLYQRMLPWKWYTLRFTDQGQGKQAEVEAIEADIIQKSGVISV